MEENLNDLSNAIEDFRQARSQADLQGLLARLTGESNQLLSYDEVRQMLRLRGGQALGVRDIPLDAIIGSVGRYNDFTRDFLPRREVRPERWARVRVATSGLIGLPPIDVYKIGEVYFVQDGNHRVSVARQLDAKFIQAFVTDVHTHVPLTPDIKPDDLILKAEYSQFLEQTELAHLRPEADLSVTIPGQYPILLEHIDAHRYFMGIDFQRPVNNEEAVTHWYDHVYSPVIEIINCQSILHEFPGRTETDLYLWIAENRRELEQEFGFPIRTESLVSYLTEEYGQGWVSKLGGKLLELVIPERLESGPPAGRWRGQVNSRADDRLFAELLTPINGQEDGWCALEQALVVARREGAILHGLHVLPGEETETPDLQAMQAEFQRRCSDSGVQGNLVISQGEIVDQTIRRAIATDLVVVNLSYPPGEQPISRLQSGFRNLINRCPRPVLATPQTISPLSHALLAFDNSAKAREALFVATYLVKKWGIPLDVVSVEDGNRINGDTLEEAKAYLQKHGVQAGFSLESGDPGEALLQTCERQACDLIIMGGYGLNPVLEIMLGSTVDKVLRQSNVPSLICR